MIKVLKGKFEIKDFVSYEKFFNNSKVSFKYIVYIQPVSGCILLVAHKPPIKIGGQ